MGTSSTWCLALAFATTAAGCGRLGFDPARAANTADGGGGDSMLDAVVSPDAADGLLTVTTHAWSHAGVQSAVTVWTSTPTGAIDDVQLTDATGVAHLHIQAGGAVTAEYSADQEEVALSANVHTILGVEPGDSFTFGGIPADCVPTTRGAATLTFSTLGGASYYLLASSCGLVYVPSSPATLELATSDPDPGDVALSAVDTSGALLEFALHADVPMGDGAFLTLSGADWSSPITTTLGVSNVPAGYSQGSLATTEYRAGSSLALWNTATTGTIVADGISMSVPVPAVTAAVTTQFRGVTASGSDGFDFQPATGVPAIVALPALPPIVSAATFDPPSRTVGWTTTASAGTADRVEVWLPLDFGEWSVWAPPSATSVTLPIVPSSTTDYNPSITGVVPAVIVVDYADQAGWNDARFAPEWDSVWTNHPHPHLATMTNANGL